MTALIESKVIVVFPSLKKAMVHQEKMDAINIKKNKLNYSLMGIIAPDKITVTYYTYGKT